MPPKKAPAKKKAAAAPAAEPKPTQTPEQAAAVLRGLLAAGDASTLRGWVADRSKAKQLHFS